MTEREFAINVVQRLRRAGFQALWAGGCVRDELLGLSPGDYDVATDARPEQVQELFRRSIAVGASFGVIEVIGPKAETGHLTVEVATFRSDVSYSDGRHPDSVVFSSAEDDARRRDFTINGMFFDPVESRLIDYVGGQADLQARVVRAIGDPLKRFAEDKLRMLRGVRIATRFDFVIEPATGQAMRKMAKEISVVSAERIAEELRKLIVHPHRARGLQMLDEVGLLKEILPEVVLMKGLPQGPPQAPTGDLWDHVLAVLNLLGSAPSFSLAFAALLHDVGKPRTVARTPERYTFHQHEHVGRRIAEEIADRLRFSNQERDRICWLVEKHQYLCEVRQMRTSKLKQILAHPGIRELLDLHRADALASGRDADHVAYCEQLLAEWSEADLNPPPIITGHDLLKLGLQRGALFKTILDAVRDAQLDGTIKTEHEALDLAMKLGKESGQGE
jgi:poly(A) polymerase